MKNNLIIFSCGYIAICTSAFMINIPLGLFVFGAGLIAIGLLFDLERL
tara:strand:+ start:1440 stop:1583 length:144 start_codon:yes stop_codon:yes gene_type:complete